METLVNQFFEQFLGKIADFLKEEYQIEASVDQLATKLNLTQLKTLDGKRQCAWIIKRKTSKEGERCPKFAVEGSDYCSTCKTKVGAGGPGRKNASKKKKEVEAPPPEEVEEEIIIRKVGYSNDNPVSMDEKTYFLFLEETIDQEKSFSLIGKLSSNLQDIYPIDADLLQEAQVIYGDGIEVKADLIGTIDLLND